MKEFEVEITEILSKKIKFKAKDQHEACKIAKKAYEKSDIVLGADDFTEVRYINLVTKISLKEQKQ